jgi:hypothetical protein
VRSWRAVCADGWRRSHSGIRLKVITIRIAPLPEQFPWFLGYRADDLGVGKRWSIARGRALECSGELDFGERVYPKEPGQEYALALLRATYRGPTPTDGSRLEGRRASAADDVLRSLRFTFFPWCFQAVVEREAGKKPLVAQFGGFAIRRRKDAILVDQRPPTSYTKGTELLKRLQADACEFCGSTIRVEVHHLRKLADLNRRRRKEIPAWFRLMVARKRKTLIACRACHEAIHVGRPTKQALSA